MNNLKIKNVQKKYKDNVIIDEVSFEFQSSNVYGIKGINGSGKTILLKLLSGLISPSSGVVEYNGERIEPAKGFPCNVGVCFSDVLLDQGLTVKQNLTQLAKIRKQIDEERIDYIIKRVGLEVSDGKKLKKCSLGMNQRANIAQIFMEQNDVYILDEPTNGLDIEGVVMLREMINEKREEGALIIFTSHNQEDIEVLANVKLELNNRKLTEL